jgi:shikimate kinase
VSFSSGKAKTHFATSSKLVIDELTLGPSCVLSSGGGTVLRPANREHLRARSQVVYLHSIPEEVFRRLRHDQNRPLLQVADPLARLRDLYAAATPSTGKPPTL